MPRLTDDATTAALVAGYDELVNRLGLPPFRFQRKDLMAAIRDTSGVPYGEAGKYWDAVLRSRAFTKVASVKAGTYRADEDSRMLLAARGFRTVLPGKLDAREVLELEAILHEQPKLSGGLRALRRKLATVARHIETHRTREAA